MPDLEVALAFELPDLVALRRVSTTFGRAVLNVRGEPALERVRRLDDVVVDRDDRVLHLAGAVSGRKRSLDSSVVMSSACYEQ